MTPLSKREREREIQERKRKSPLCWDNAEQKAYREILGQRKYRL